MQYFSDYTTPQALIERLDALLGLKERALAITINNKTLHPGEHYNLLITPKFDSPPLVLRVYFNTTAETPELCGRLRVGTWDMADCYEVEGVASALEGYLTCFPDFVFEELLGYGSIDDWDQFTQHLMQLRCLQAFLPWLEQNLETYGSSDYLFGFMRSQQAAIARLQAALLEISPR